MDPNRTSPSTRPDATAQVPRRQQPAAEVHANEPTIARDSLRGGPRRIGYGLPCAHCKAYFAADLTACPYCGCAERVSANQEQVEQPANTLKEELRSLQAEIAEVLRQNAPGQADPLGNLDEERERTLREYKAQLYANHTQINPAAAFRCSLDRNHRQGSEPAAICKSCYNDVGQRLEQMEAALCIDVREAAQVIYDAVWSDPTPNDPSRTYQNAAQAILTELRRRAGIAVLFGPVGYAH